MRDFKFRAWDEDENSWLNIRHFGFDVESLWYVQAIDENEKDIDPPYFVEYNEVKLMQYIGIKDKNGVDIYEGDIVARSIYQITSRENDDGTISTLIHTNKPKVQTLGVIKYSEKDARFETGNTPIWLGHYEDIEVIGNIYENPDLISK